MNVGHANYSIPEIYSHYYTSVIITKCTRLAVIATNLARSTADLNYPTGHFTILEL